MLQLTHFIVNSTEQDDIETYEIDTISKMKKISGLYWFVRKNYAEKTWKLIENIIDKAQDNVRNVLKKYNRKEKLPKNLSKLVP